MRMSDLAKRRYDLVTKLIAAAVSAGWRPTIRDGDGRAVISPYKVNVPLKELRTTFTKILGSRWQT